MRNDHGGIPGEEPLTLAVEEGAAGGSYAIVVLRDDQLERIVDAVVERLRHEIAFNQLLGQPVTAVLEQAPGPPTAEEIAEAIEARLRARSGW